MQRFKGLEVPIILLWGADGLEPTADQEILYVTLSRAKSRLCLVGHETGCRLVLEASGLTQDSTDDCTP